MSNCGRFIDRNPALRPAGKVTSMPGESTETCIKTGETGRQTPPHIKKYRKSFNADPGAKQIHYGVADD